MRSSTRWRNPAAPPASTPRSKTVSEHAFRHNSAVHQQQEKMPMTPMAKTHHAQIIGVLLCMTCLPALAQSPIVLKLGNASYESALGSGCWDDLADGDGMCDDHFAEVTPSTPIVVRCNETISFEI